MHSQRQDGRGHWPAGKLRSSLPAPEYRAAVRRIRIAQDRGSSLTRIATRLGISLRALRRWLAGEHRPMPQSLRRLDKALK